ncbi:MAG: macro domain-containing protein [Salinibacter sp.]|uniref:type II toxin-antitoxin system antitoxin DNA ADP-ribosyl glycohydrolase DarG n=1 Tax=Salinibacter sp. TaxID=2065818 RepID=UPI0035D3F8FF
MVEIRQGDLFDADVEALVDPVNCAGTMSRGVSAQFRVRFPRNAERYRTACSNDQLAPGDVLVFDRGGLFGDQDAGPRYILNVATKAHWSGTSKLSQIDAGVATLVQEAKARDLASLALPALGCGGGGLDWTDVRPLIESHFASLASTQVLLFAPSDVRVATRDAAGREQPTMTRGRALLLVLMENFRDGDGWVTVRNVQALAYLLQNAGEELGLRFEPGAYGLHASGLPRVLQHIAGHFIIAGEEPRRSESAVRPRPDAIDEARRVIKEAPDAEEHLASVRRLIAGASTSDDLDLLAVVLWIVQSTSRARRRPEAAVRAVQNDSRWKSERFAPEDLAAAWRRLRTEGLHSFDTRDDGEHLEAG